MDYNEMIRIRRELHQIPELGFKEVKTQKYLLDYIHSLPDDHIEVETWRTGIFVRVEGTIGEKTIGYRTDIDGLPITEETGFEFQSRHEGQMHACGHDFHMTIALGILTELVEHRPEHHVLMIFQPAEEGPGGAAPMLESEPMKRWWPDTIFALHIAPELPAGTVSTKEGLLFANTSELFIDLKGKGGHAAYPHQTKDMVVAASALVTDLQQIVARMIDPLDAAVISIGKITGGTVQNIIAEQARLEGTMRTLNAGTMDFIKSRIEKMTEAIELRFDCKATIDYGSNYYQVWNQKTYTDQFETEMNRIHVPFKKANEAMTGEDFGYMLKEIPGFMYWLGVDSPHGLHHAKLNPKEEAIQTGVKAGVQMLHHLK
ncbi:N-acetyldiaminopimelate deacetylase [Virgibacillus sp. MSP4-1]|uniref:N-acetyldiaminopimelate deacetylase n=1 Tax=Virgibacillus sp. MSP4-1 TaxID=2700081 RepID=UPI0003AB43CB|nr:N-acetyldiaminopimelate deacetylase [Virgibacillus sp. MSP4-1]QHS22093.1 N-acetyldiaminopimelate deacetylase [Virgibacillus sp. MSP4-1]